ncbi:hypothetical protein PROFUN_16504, partial [Planoprotostelium fungivorum]
MCFLTDSMDQTRSSPYLQYSPIKCDHRSKWLRRVRTCPWVVVWYVNSPFLQHLFSSGISRGLGIIGANGCVEYVPVPGWSSGTLTALSSSTSSPQESLPTIGDPRTRRFIVSLDYDIYTTPSLLNKNICTYKKSIPGEPWRKEEIESRKRREISRTGNLQEALLHEGFLDVHNLPDGDPAFISLVQNEEETNHTKSTNILKSCVPLVTSSLTVHRSLLLISVYIQQ